VEADPHSIGPVRMSYSPRTDGAPDPGEVVWTWVPFEENDGRGKDRPAPGGEPATGRSRPLTPGFRLCAGASWPLAPAHPGQAGSRETNVPQFARSVRGAFGMNSLPIQMAPSP
jgi:hypothetical protein